MKRLAILIRLLFLALFILLAIIGKPMLWMVIFGVSLLSTFLFGRFYCGYICPMNTLMRPIEWLAERFKLPAKAAPSWLQKTSQPWIFLGLSVVLVVGLRMVARIQLPFLIVWLVIAGLVALVYRSTIFHIYICPFSAPLRVLGGYTRHSQQVSPEDCIACGKCVTVCPSNAMTLQKPQRFATIEPKACHQCQDCQAVCPSAAIHYQPT